MKMKRLVMAFFTASMAMAVIAQVPDNKKFSPEAFDAELQMYITKEASLTQQEAAKFFPIYKEMQQKQRALFGKQRQIGKDKPSDEMGCENAIRKRDEIDFELKRIQKSYHDKMLKVISASKLYDVIKAEDNFHRQAFRNWGHRPKTGHNKK